MTKYPKLVLLIVLLTGFINAPLANSAQLSFSDSSNKNVVGFTSFSDRFENDRLCINWAVSKNEEIDQFIVETSSDGKSFTEKAIVFSSEQNANADYKLYIKADKKLKTFRVRLITKSGSVIYSQTFHTSNKK